MDSKPTQTRMSVPHVAQAFLPVLVLDVSWSSAYRAGYGGT